MNISTSSQNYTYTKQSGTLNLMGNSNNLILKQCIATINVMGNSNNFTLVDCRIQLNINGNSNNVAVRAGELKVGINGCSNQIRNVGQQAVIECGYTNGVDNFVDRSGLGHFGQSGSGSSALNNSGFRNAAINAQNSQEVLRQGSQLGNQGSPNLFRAHNSSPGFNTGYGSNSNPLTLLQSMFTYSPPTMSNASNLFHNSHNNPNQLANGFMPIPSMNNSRSGFVPLQGNTRHSPNRITTGNNVRSNDQERTSAFTSINSGNNRVPNSRNGNRPNSWRLINDTENDDQPLVGTQVEGLFAQRNGTNYTFTQRQRAPTFLFRPYNRAPFRTNQNPPTSSQGLTASQLAMLPTSKYEGKSAKCSICLDDMSTGEKVTYLFCFHVFHCECCVSWLKKSATCPLCMIDVKQHLNQSQ